MKKPPVFNVGRFQVTPSKDGSRQELRPLSRATPTAHSPPPFRKTQTESSSDSESGIRTSTPAGNHDDTGGRRARKGEDDKGRESQSDGSSGSPMMSSSFSQSLSHSAPYASSDESESEDEDTWEELQKLRQR